jgi:hypothetical protein
MSSKDRRTNSPHPNRVRAMEFCTSLMCHEFALFFFPPFPGFTRYFQVHAPLVLHGAGFYYDPHGIRYPAMLAQRLAQVVRGNVDYVSGLSLSMFFLYLYLVRFVNYGLYKVLYKILHRCELPAWSAITATTSSLEKQCLVCLPSEY